MFWIRVLILAGPCFLIALSLPIAQQHAAPRNRLDTRQTDLNTFLAILAKNVPIFNGSLRVVAGALATYTGLLATLTGTKITYDGLSNKCAAYTLIFARGTAEPGNVGVLVGPPFIMALKDRLGAQFINVQGVKYGASYEGYFHGGDPAGSQLMAATIASATQACPNTRVVVSGYSQGAQLVHNAMEVVTSETAARVHAIVLFGDPDNGQGFGNVDSRRVQTYCDLTDNICDNGDLILPAHLSYAVNVKAAAAFVATV